MIRHAVHSSHQFLGEVTNQITYNYLKSQFFPFQVLEESVAERFKALESKGPGFEIT